MLDNKLSKLFLGQAKLLQQQLEKLLDKDIHPTKKSNELFETKTLRQVPNFIIDSSQPPREQMVQIFNQSTPYFYSGLLFELGENSRKCIAAFDQGVFFPLKGPEIDLDFIMPDMNLVEVMKVQSEKIFASLEKLNVIHSQNTDVFLLKPHPQFAILVCITLGDPWLKIHMENYQKALLKVAGDF